MLLTRLLVGRLNRRAVPEEQVLGGCAAHVSALRFVRTQVLIREDDPSLLPLTQILALLQQKPRLDDILVTNKQRR